MICNNLYFDYATIINMFIGSVIGFGLSYWTALVFEKINNERNLKNLKNEFEFLKSKNDEFDWQHWQVENGQIADKPINSFMRTKYISGKIFDYEWIENGKIQGNGKLIWEDITHGYLSFFSINTIMYNHRKIFYRIVEHQSKSYDAIFVNAEDQGYSYVLMRKK